MKSFKVNLMQNFLLLLLGIIFITSCKDKETTLSLQVLDFTPERAAPLDTLRIYGSGFSSNAQENKVIFGTDQTSGLEAQVLKAAPTWLEVIVPEEVPFGELRIFVSVSNGPVVQSNFVFRLADIPITGQIIQNTTLQEGRIYLLIGLVVVKSGATLTIPKNVIIKGEKESNAALVIERGAKIIAKGTASEPIVFTSNQPQGAGRDARDWVGLVILGNAPNSQGTNLSFDLIKGQSFKHGGPSLEDNSGELEYIRIEFTGQRSDKVPEALPGLTLASVGRGTKISNVQVSFTESDGFRFLGGNVDVKNLITWACKEDDFDLDQGYNGRMQFLLANRDPFVSAVTDFSDGIEIKNANASIANYTYLGGMALVRNLTNQGADLVVSDANGGNVVVSPRHGMGVFLREVTQNQVFNSVIIGSSVAGIGLTTQSVENYNEDTEMNNRLVGNAILGYRQDNIGTNNANLLAGGFGIIEQLNGGNEPQFFNHFLAGSEAERVRDLFLTINEQQIGVPVNTPSRDLDELTSNIFEPWGVHTMAAYNTTNPNFLPSNDRLRASSTNKSVVGDNFLENVPYKGAFGTTDWTKGGWANFNPRAQEY